MSSTLFNDEEMKKIFNPVTMEIITIVDINPGINSSDIQKQTKRQYAYIIKTVDFLIDKGILKSEKVERSNKLYVTDKGKNVADDLLQAIDTVNDL